MKKRLKNSKNKQKDLSTIVFFLVVVVIGMSIAYAALSSTLTISMNQVTQNSLSWDVAFQTGTVTGTPGGSSSSTGRSCGNATVTADSVTVADTLLSKPDDSCTYKLVIKNTGSVDAKLGTITPLSPDSISCTTSGASMVCGNITYELATVNNGSTLLSTDSVLPKTNGTLTVYLILKYTGSTPSDTEAVQSNGGFTLVYNQF